MTRPRGRFRAVGLVLGSLSGITMIVVGCTSLVDGAPSVNPPDATSYRASVSTSEARSSSRAAAQQSERRASMTTRAVHGACEALSVTSVNAVDAVNAFVFAFNRNEPGQDELSTAAVESLTVSADTVSTSLSPPLTDELEGVLVEWIDSARAVAGVISRGFELDQFNSAVDRLNEVKTRALALCDASY